MDISRSSVTYNKDGRFAKECDSHLLAHSAKVLDFVLDIIVKGDTLLLMLKVDTIHTNTIVQGRTFARRRVTLSSSSFRPSSFTLSVVMPISHLLPSHQSMAAITNGPAATFPSLLLASKPGPFLKG